MRAWQPLRGPGAPPRWPDPVETHRAGTASKRKARARARVTKQVNAHQKASRRRSHLRRARFFGTHAPRDKENQPEMPERKHAGAPLASWCDRVVAKLTP